MQLNQDGKAKCFSFDTKAVLSATRSHPVLNYSWHHHRQKD